jgi:dUTP pyrophosphatase
MMTTTTVSIVKLHKGAKIPQYMTTHAAAFDFFLPEDICLLPGQVEIIKTGLAMKIPVGKELQIRPRSGLSLSTGLRIANAPGTVDCDFIGEIGIVAENTSVRTLHFKAGDRIAQGVLANVDRARFFELPSVDNLPATERGAGGFGHTGT